ncbi:MAG: hypothetical protein QXU99_00405 [Candidatus Bathyarchaeia archaeon]
MGGDVSFVVGQDNYPLMAHFGFEHDMAASPPVEPCAIVVTATVAIAIVGVGVYFRRFKRGNRHEKDNSTLLRHVGVSSVYNISPACFSASHGSSNYT